VSLSCTRNVLSAWVGCLALLVSLGAHGQLSMGITVDSKANSLGGAVVADIDPHLATVYHNPAGLAKLKERHFEVDQILIGFDVDADYYAPEDYTILGLDGNGYNTYDETVPRDPIIDGDRRGDSHSNKPALYIPGWGYQQWVWSGPVPLLFQIGFSVNPPGSKFTFGTKNYMLATLAVFKDAEDGGIYLGKEAAIQRYTYFSPTMGYEINDEWAVGVGIQFSHQGFAVAQHVRAPNMLVAVNEVLQDAFACEFDKPIGNRRDPLQPWLSMCQGNVGPWDTGSRLELDMQETLSTSYNVGVLWEPTDWLSWGATYMSGSEVNLKGTFLNDYTDEWEAFWRGFNASIEGAITAAVLGLPRGVDRESGHVNLKLDWPQMFKSGLRVRLSPSFTLETDATWTDWSVWDEWHIVMDRKLESFQAARLLSTYVTDNSVRAHINLVDTWHWGFGLTHHINSRLDVRYGLEMRKSPAEKEVFGPIPIGDTKLWGIGFGYKWDKQTQISSSAFYMQSVDYIPANTSSNLNDTGLTNVVYNPYAGLDVKFSTRVFGLGVVFRRTF
jgi:long-subunit fatty acid transport protein